MSMRLGQTSAIFFVSKFSGSIIGFAATVVFARLLGEAVLGQYALVLALVTWLSVVGKVGLSESIAKRLSEGEEVEEYLGAGLLVMAVIGFTISLGVLAFRRQVNGYVDTPVATVIVVILLATLFNAYGSSALRGRHLVHVSSVLSTVSQLLRSAIQIGLLLAGFGLQAMLVAYALSRAVPGVVAFRYIETHPTIPAKKHFKSLFDFAKFSWLGNIQAKAFNTLDVMLLGVFVSPGYVGVYSAAWSIGLVLDIFGNAIRSTLFPEMSKVANRNDTDTVAGLTEDALTYSGLFLIPGVVGGVLVGDRLLHIYGEGFAIGTQVLGLLLLALLVYAYTKQLLNTLNAVDRPDLAFRTNVVFVGSNAALNVALIYLYGWVGAAVATLLSGVVGAAIAGHYVNRLLSVRVPIGEISRQWIAALAMGVVLYTARMVSESHWIARHNAVYVVSFVAFGAAVYFASLLMISTRFRTTVSENMPTNVQT